MQYQNLTELSMEDLTRVAGGGYSAEWGIATGVAVGLAGGAATVIAAPVIAGAFAFGSIGASALAIYYALR